MKLYEPRACSAKLFWINKGEKKKHIRVGEESLPRCNKKIPELRGCLASFVQHVRLNSPVCLEGGLQCVVWQNPFSYLTWQGKRTPSRGVWRSRLTASLASVREQKGHGFNPNNSRRVPRQLLMWIYAISSLEGRNKAKRREVEVWLYIADVCLWPNNIKISSSSFHPFFPMTSGTLWKTTSYDWLWSNL